MAITFLDEDCRKRLIVSLFVNWCFFSNFKWDPYQIKKMFKNKMNNLKISSEINQIYLINTPSILLLKTKHVNVIKQKCL